VRMVSGSPSATHESSFSIGVWFYMDIGQMAPTRVRRTLNPKTQEDGFTSACRQVARLCAPQYPQAGRETVFPGKASDIVAGFTLPREWECIHTYVVQQEQYNRFEQA